MNSRILAGLAGLALVLAGCTGGVQQTQESSPKAPAANTTDSFKVALLTPGEVSDAGWSAMAYDGLKAIESELGATVNNQVAGIATMRDAMRSYAQDGYQLVIGHGFEYNEPALEIAKDFPETMFVSSSGAGTATNVGAFRFYLEQGFYLAGAMAATMSKSGTIAMIGGPEVPSIASTFDAFRAGATSVNPQIRVIESYTGKDDDIAAAKQATLAAIDQGADFVIHQANAAAQGVFDACRERNVYAFGANLNQNDNPSGRVLASAVIIAKPAFVALAQEVREGTYKGSVQLKGMEDGAIDFVINPELEAQIPPEAKASIESLKARILDGSLTVPKAEF